MGNSRFQVLVDQSGEIPTGEAWFPYLSEWMAECDGAVILFSKEALESQWVRAEAAILSWRKRRQPSFKLIGVLLDGVKPEDFDDDAFFRVIRINDFQHVRDCETEQQILSKIEDAFADIETPEESPFEQLSTLMRETLLTVQPDALKRTWQYLKATEKPNWRPEMDFASSLARLLFREPANALLNMRIIVEKLANVLDKQKATKMLELVKGLWVSGEAAGTLAWIRDDGRAAMINGEDVHEFTGHSYIRRSWPFPQDYKLLSTGGCQSFKGISEILLAPFLKSTEERHARRRLERYVEPLFLVFPFSEDYGVDQLDTFPDPGLVSDISRAHPNVTIVVSTGAKIPDNVQYLEPVLPELEVDQEFEQLDLHCDVVDYINSQIAV